VAKRKRREERIALERGIKALVLQELRLLRMDKGLMPEFLADAMRESLEEARRTINGLLGGMDEREKNRLLRRMFRQAVDEELDEIVGRRKAKCLRCAHRRFYDEAGVAHLHLPAGGGMVGSVSRVVIGCDQPRPDLRRKCTRFVEVRRFGSVDDFIEEMDLYYRIREALSRLSY
jgi:hypothetical protein